MYNESTSFITVPAVVEDRPLVVLLLLLVRVLMLVTTFEVTVECCVGELSSRLVLLRLALHLCLLGDFEEEWGEFP